MKMIICVNPFKSISSNCHVLVLDPTICPKNRSRLRVSIKEPLEMPGVRPCGVCHQQLRVATRPQGSPPLSAVPGMAAAPRSPAPPPMRRLGLPIASCLRHPRRGCEGGTGWRRKRREGRKERSRSARTNPKHIINVIYLGITCFSYIVDAAKAWGKMDF